MNGMDWREGERESTRKKYFEIWYMPWRSHALFFLFSTLTEYLNACFFVVFSSHFILNPSSTHNTTFRKYYSDVYHIAFDLNAFLLTSCLETFHWNGRFGVCFSPLFLCFVETKNTQHLNKTFIYSHLLNKKNTILLR